MTKYQPQKSNGNKTRPVVKGLPFKGPGNIVSSHVSLGG